jgi:hypothetical protein
MSNRGTIWRRAAWGASWIAAAGLLHPACATSVQTYGKNEYVVVANGVAPDQRYAVAAHGTGDDGFEDFHLYLLAEPGGRVIGPLEEVRETLDTAASAYAAEWSASSEHVALLYRSDRHITALNLYRIGQGRAYPITGATPLAAVAGPDVGLGQNIELRSSYLELAWLGPNRFVLREESILKLGSPGVAGKLGKFAQPDADTANTDSKFFKFAAEAECELGPGDTYKIVSLKPGRASP